jgi:hypothetical protein
LFFSTLPPQPVEQTTIATTSADTKRRIEHPHKAKATKRPTVLPRSARHIDAVVDANHGGVVLPLSPAGGGGGDFGGALLLLLQPTLARNAPRSRNERSFLMPSILSQ